MTHDSTLPPPFLLLSFFCLYAWNNTLLSCYKLSTYYYKITTPILSLSLSLLWCTFSRRFSTSNKKIYLFFFFAIYFKNNNIYKYQWVRVIVEVGTNPTHCNFYIQCHRVGICWFGFSWHGLWSVMCRQFDRLSSLDPMGFFLPIHMKLGWNFQCGLERVHGPNQGPHQLKL